MQIHIGNLPPWNWDEPAERLVELAQLCEKVGVDRFSISDVRFQADCLAMVTSCAMATKKIMVGSLVTDPFTRHPSLTACAMATIADLSRGRVVLGLGGGREQPSYWGESREKAATALREAVYVTRAMWAGKTVDFDGEVISIHGAKLRFPVKYKIPILIAARTRRAKELAGELADIVHLGSYFNDRMHYEDNLEHVGRGVKKGKRSWKSIEVDKSIMSCVCDDEKKALESSKVYTAIGILWAAGMDSLARKNYRHWKPPRNFSVPEGMLETLSKWEFWRNEPLPESVRTKLDREIIDQFAVSGTPKQVGERLVEFKEYPRLGGIRIQPLPVEGKSNYEGYREMVIGLGKALRHVRSRLKR